MSPQPEAASDRAPAQADAPPANPPDPAADAPPANPPCRGGACPRPQPAELDAARVDARDPGADAPLLGLEGWRRAALAALHAGCPAVTLLARDAEHRAALEEAVDADSRLERVAVALFAPGEPNTPAPNTPAPNTPAPNAPAPDERALLLDGAGVYDPAGVAALARGEQGGVALGGDVRRPARVRVLQRSVAGHADGLVDTWLNRPVARGITRALTHTRISPNAVTLLAFAVGVAGVAGVASRDWTLGLVGALLVQASATLDCVDGELARLTYRFTPFGARLDLLLDNVTHLLLFAAIAWASVPLWDTSYALGFGGAMVAGGLLAFGIVWWTTFVRPAPRGGRLARLLERVTNRDFSLVVILAAAAGRWDLLLAVMAVGVNLFWPLLLFATLREPSEAPDASRA